MRHAWQIARWEFSGTLRNRQFLLTTVLIPLIILGSIVVTLVIVAPELRGSLSGIDAEALRQQIEEATGADPQQFISPILATVFASIFLFVVLFSGTFVLQNVVREKQSRMVEMLLAATSPRQLIAGKILAFGALGLVQAAIWVGVGLLSLLLVGPYLNVPVWPLLALLAAYLPWGKLLVFTVFFVLGYLFISSFSAAMGATMSDVFSGQQLQSLIVMLPAILPLSLLNLLIDNPENAFFRALSFFPPSIPGAMMLRMSLADVPTWEVAASLVVLALSTWGMIRLAGKIFEVGILMYGKSASWREIWRWVRG